MNPTDAINQLALSVIAGAYILLFLLQLVLWNRMEKMITAMEKLNIEVAGSLPAMHGRMNAIEKNQEHMEMILDKIRLNAVHTRIRES